jgi:hypothetical protein
MEFSYNFESLNITNIIKDYKGKQLDELFKTQKVIENGLGEFLEISRDSNEKIPTTLNLKASRRSILCNLKTVYNIGEITEKRFINKGVKTLYDLRYNIRFRNAANEILSLIKRRDFHNLNRNKYVYDLDTSFCFNQDELLFFDIETLGIYDSPIIIIGLGYYLKETYHIIQLFARGLEEEIALCEHLRAEVLPLFKCFVSYNGKSFDIPYLANRFLYYFDENPMISEADTPYKDFNTKFGHIDLYHNCRRKFKGRFLDYTLSTIEKDLLNWERENELASNLVGICYKKYLKDPEKYIGLVKECIDHNYFDILSLPLIYDKLLKCI